MKKYLVILLSVLFVLSTVGFVIADDGGMDSVRAMKPGAKVQIGGDARVRTTYLKKTDFTDNDSDNRFTDQRIRLKIKGDAGNGVSANLRLYIANSVKWDGAANACTGCIRIDYAYVTVPVSTLTVNAGLIKKYYGLAFMRGNTEIPGIQTDQWDNRFESYEVIGKFETVTVKVFLNKQIDTFDTVVGDDNLKDFNDYGVSLVADLGDIEVGGMVLYHHDNRAEVGAAGGTAADQGFTGTDISIYAKGKVSNIGLGGEIVFLTGDMNEDSAGETPLGLMVYAETTVGAIGVRADAAYVSNSYTASYSYTPTLVIGTVQQTGIFDMAAADDAKAWLIAGSANTDVMENVNILGRVAYASFEDPTGGDDPNILELDGVVKVQIAKNARSFIEVAYVNPSDELGEDAAIVFANRVELYF
jgi:hypothetical protein